MDLRVTDARVAAFELDHQTELDTEPRERLLGLLDTAAVQVVGSGHLHR